MPLGNFFPAERRNCRPSALRGTVGRALAIAVAMGLAQLGLAMRLDPIAA